MNTEVKKAIGVFFISLFTLGLASIVFVYLISDRAKTDSNNKILYPMRECVLYTVTLGFYGFLWIYKLGRRIDVAEGESDISAQTKGSVLLMLPFLRSIGVAYTYYRLKMVSDAT